MTRFLALPSRTRLAEALSSRRRQVAAALLGLGALALIALSLGSGEPDPVGGPTVLRRLTETQYRATIADVFAPDIPVNARFEKPVRYEGLVAIGTGTSGMSPFAMEQYDTAAQGIAAAVLSAKRRKDFLPCLPANAKAFHEECAREFLSDVGLMLFRRPLSATEVSRYVGLARRTQEQLGNFYTGLELSLYTMLVSPEFLFRIEQAKPGADDGTGELDAYSKAARLSYFLTNSTPDRELLRAAGEGELDSRWGLSRQVDRLMASDRFEGAVEAFFADMLQFDRFDELSKDPAIYPAFNSDVIADAQEQTLRTIVNHLVTEDADYRDLFTTRETFLTRPLGVIYRTPVPTRGDWEHVVFANDANRAGIQSHVSFLALHSHPGRSSPTLRGYAVRQVFLCQHVPDPPANVDFSAVEENAHQKNSTARDRLVMHSTEPSCAGCHKVMDPLGLTMEQYDGVGTFRTRENGAFIDTSGSLDGTDFNTTAGLAQALRNHPETPRCVAERMFKAAVGRDITWGERAYLDWLDEQFADDGYRVPELMRRIALSRNFFAVSGGDDARGKPQVVTGRTSEPGDKS
ncbi:hypothetical protein GCM10011494_02120 [Novosphingobium endophyticum]|uniref:DUF1592 domain-containing protein n=1 Tax=Novosphingobium endophyticum TaxID=1955250 RepID=A0A916TPI5_9SPHN|nr:DUF1592 domain-containing protein [Novosphingobium endophyticum]GGB87349.1 hypothetical protein GCM10011494_02120 [Novosphingobium endophyticum]